MGCPPSCAGTVLGPCHEARLTRCVRLSHPSSSPLTCQYPCKAGWGQGSPQRPQMQRRGPRRGGCPREPALGMPDRLRGARGFWGLGHATGQPAAGLGSGLEETSEPREGTAPWWLALAPPQTVLLTSPGPRGPPERQHRGLVTVTVIVSSSRGTEALELPDPRLPRCCFLSLRASCGRRWKQAWGGGETRGTEGGPGGSGERCHRPVAQRLMDLGLPHPERPGLCGWPRLRGEARG